MCSGRIRVAINKVEAVSAIKAMLYGLDRLIHNTNIILNDFDSAVVTVLILCCCIASVDGLNSNLKGELRIIQLIRFGKQAICAFPGTVT